MAFRDLLESSFSEGNGGNDPSWFDEFAVQPSEGELLICVPVRQQSGGITVVDGDGNPFTQAVLSTGTFAPLETGIFYKLANDNQHVRVTMTPSADDLVGLAIARFEGPWAVSPLDRIASGFDTNSSTCPSGTTQATTEEEELAICGFVCGPAVGPSLSDSFILDEFIDHTAGSSQRPDGILGHKVLSGLQTVSTLLTIGASVAGSSGCVATFKGAAVAAGGAAGVRGLTSQGLVG